MIVMKRRYIKPQSSSLLLLRLLRSRPIRLWFWVSGDVVDEMSAVKTDTPGGSATLIPNFLFCGFRVNAKIVKANTDALPPHLTAKQIFPKATA